MTKYYFYLARCNDNTLYSGYTNNIKRREHRHNLGEGAKYTRRRLPIKIIYWEKYDTRIEAMRRETQVKRWSKIKKENLIKYKKPLK
ncbi:MAG: GIY-YIG nuclease family protein [Patescibacteria group bacterium]